MPHCGPREAPDSHRALADGARCCAREPRVHRAAMHAATASTLRTTAARISGHRALSRSRRRAQSRDSRVRSGVDPAPRANPHSLRAMRRSHLPALRVRFGARHWKGSCTTPTEDIAGDRPARPVGSLSDHGRGSQRADRTFKRSLGGPRSPNYVKSGQKSLEGLTVGPCS